jgi:hypothetical protein
MSSKHEPYIEFIFKFRDYRFRVRIKFLELQLMQIV